MIYSGLQSMVQDSEVKPITGFIEAHDQTTNNNRTTQIVVGSVCFLFILISQAIVGHLCKETTVCHYQRRMNNMLCVIRNIRDEYQSRNNVQRTKDDLSNIGQTDAQVKHVLREMLSSQTNKVDHCIPLQFHPVKFIYLYLKDGLITNSRSLPYMAV